MTAPERTAEFMQEPELENLRAIKELRSRVEELERQVNDLKRLLSEAQVALYLRNQAG